MRYAYAVTSALLLGGSAIVLATGQPLGAGKPGTVSPEALSAAYEMGNHA